MSRLTNYNSWKLLQHHQKVLEKINLPKLFKNDPQRFDCFSFQFKDIVIDFSKNLVTQETLDLLINLANECNLSYWIKKLFQGDIVNKSENRAAWHVALRSSQTKPMIKRQLERIKEFVSNLNNTNITDIVHVGVGGSDLGPRLIVNACQKQSKFSIHFVSCLDGEKTLDLMKKLDPITTLIIVVSKSFTTVDTLSNAKILSDWIKIKSRIVGISANPVAMTKFGILPENQFLFWEEVGGRYSLWSAVGLVIAIALGFREFKELLSAAELVDTHFLNNPFHQNIPVIMGLLTVWYTNFWQSYARAILPYSSRLALLPSYLQQLEMESCGKRVTQEGEIVDYAIGQVIFGEVGFNAQHAFMQMLHQGKQLIPVDFILPDHREVTLATALAQSQALMLGKNEHTLPPYRKSPGNRPSTVIIFPAITPKTLGMLLAIYEHKVFTQSVIWEINPFDQWGVELGKSLRTPTPCPFFSS